jgi:hypothetical protein
MARKILYGLMWCVVLYVGGQMVVGGIAGGIAGSKYPGDLQAAGEAGRIAGEEAVAEYRPYIVFGAVSLAVLGSGAGILPGTKVV